MTLTQSKKIFNQARQVLVGGVNSPVRAFNGVGGTPLVMAKGNGSLLTDIDGNKYQDYCLSWGALILGHNYPDVRKAATTAIAHGSSFGTTTTPEIDIAQFITKHVPSIDKIRFVNSGTEATMSAIRLARAFTKRDKIIKFDGCYHGHADDLLSVAGSGVAHLPASSSLGIPKSHLSNTLSLPYNDVGAFTKIIDRHHKDLACVIVEPVAGNMGVVLPHLEFLKTLRLLTKKYGIVLIFDEVMTGFRSSLGCVQQDMNIIPDMTCLGKIIGGGYPVGAYGGRKDIMNHLAPMGGAYQAGTFAGNPLVMRAGLATLNNLNVALYKGLKAKCDAITADLNKFFMTEDIAAHMVNYHSMMSLRFTCNPVLNYNQAQNAANDPLYAKLFHYLLKNKIYWPPANLETLFVSAQHRQKDLNEMGQHIKRFFKNIHG